MHTETSLIKCQCFRLHEMELILQQTVASLQCVSCRWSSRLLMIPLVVVLVWLAVPSSGQQDVLSSINAGTSQGREELFYLLRSENIPLVIRCLANPNTQGCDRRSHIVRSEYLSVPQLL